MEWRREDDKSKIQPGMSAHSASNFGGLRTGAIAKTIDETFTPPLPSSYLDKGEVGGV